MALCLKDGVILYEMGVTHSEIRNIFDMPCFSHVRQARQHWNSVINNFVNNLKHAYLLMLSEINAYYYSTQICLVL